MSKMAFCHNRDFWKKLIPWHTQLFLEISQVNKDYRVCHGFSKKKLTDLQKINLKTPIELAKLMKMIRNKEHENSLHVFWAPPLTFQQHHDQWLPRN